jgi:hypothetical protein
VRPACGAIRLAGVTLAFVAQVLGTAVLGTAAFGGNAGCASSAHGPTTPRLAPTSAVARRAALDGLGRSLLSALRHADVGRVFFDDLALRNLLVPAAASRASAMRLGASARLGERAPALRLALDGAAYVGVCVQGSRIEASGGALGLRAEGWVIERVLLVVERRRVGELAGWVEGQFVFSDAGFGAIAVDAIEVPRVSHAALEEPVCELQSGLEAWLGPR